MKRRAILLVGAGAATLAAVGSGSAGSTADSTTISVRPTIQGRTTPLVVSGVVASRREKEAVTVQFRQCGLFPVQFRDVEEVMTGAEGTWSLETGVAANGAFRATTATGSPSAAVDVQKRVEVRLTPAPPKRWVVNVVEPASFWRKRVLLQRFDRRRGTWVQIRTLRLEHSGAAPGSYFVWSSTDPFTVKEPKGTTIRATVPLDQAKPCRIGGYSNLVQT